MDFNRDIYHFLKKCFQSKKEAFPEKIELFSQKFVLFLSKILSGNQQLKTSFTAPFKIFSKIYFAMKAPAKRFLTIYVINGFM